MPLPRDPIPDLILEQYVLGELAPAEMDALHRDIAQDADLAARVEALRASNREILTAFPPEAFAGDVARRLRTRTPPMRAPRNWRARWLVLSPALAVAAILLILIVRPLYYGTPPTIVQTRSKGLGTHLKIYRQVGPEAQLLTPAEAVSAGDLLQISYVAVREPYGMILSLDGRGSITLHFPNHVRESTRLEQEGETFIPHAYELDDAPLFERFFVVTGARPIPVTVVIAAVRALADDPIRAREAPLALPSALKQQSITLCKTEETP